MGGGDKRVREAGKTWGPEWRKGCMSEEKRRGRKRR